MCIASEEHGKYYSVHKQLICVAGDGNWTGKSALRASGLKTGDVWALQSLKAHKVQKSYFKKSVGEGLYRSFFLCPQMRQLSAEVLQSAETSGS